MNIPEPKKPLFEFKLPPESNTDLTPEFRSYMEKCISECAAKRYEMIEAMMLLFMAGTGFRPDQVELCEMHCPNAEGITMKWFIRPLPGVKTTEEGKADPCHVQVVRLPQS